MRMFFLKVGVWLCGLCVCACDWQQFALMNTIPFEGDPSYNPEVHVFLAVDGLAYETVLEAVHKGVFDEQWHVSKMVSMFPATSDASWSRILRTQVTESYEYEYYHPTKDKIENAGVFGLLSHAVPPIESIGVHVPEYIHAFDYFGNGYLDTLWKYQNTETSYADTLDSMFFQLAGFSQTQKTFLGYVLELDVLGHMQTREQVNEGLRRLAGRIAEFKRNHRERKYIFTLFSDHGMDFIHAEEDEMVQFKGVLESVGVHPVKTFKEGRSAKQVFAVPIVHTRVSYIGLHTEPNFVSEVAARISSHVSVDFAACKERAPRLEGLPEGTQWYAVWRDGGASFYFAYNPVGHVYVLPRTGAYDAYGLYVTFPDNTDKLTLTEEEAFQASVAGNYPDMLFRIRSGLMAGPVLYPADVLVSFKRPYASRGFEVPGGSNAIASSGFHGAMDDLSSAGVVFTEAKTLPKTLRADTFLTLFPELEKHLKNKGVEQRVTDQTFLLQYPDAP
jgi:hypothetical protein